MKPHNGPSQTRALVKSVEGRGADEEEEEDNGQDGLECNDHKA